jgi:hypothetical protein
MSQVELPTVGNDNGRHGQHATIDVDVPAAMTDHVVFLDLDDFIELSHFRGSRELIVVYTDHASRRQLVRVRGRRNGRKAVTA